MKTKKLLLVFIIILYIFLLSSCTITDKMPSFFQPTSHDDNTIKIAVPVDLATAKTYTSFINGIEIIKDEINQTEKDINIEILIDDDKADFISAVDLAESYIDDPNIIAVVGHWYSDICTPLTNIYEKNGKVLLIPNSTSPNIVKSNSKYIFQNVPTDTYIGEDMCNYAKKNGSKNIVILYENSSYGEVMSASLEKYAESIGLNVIDKYSGIMNETNLKQLDQKWSLLNYDTVMVVSKFQDGFQIINQMKNTNANLEYICTDGFDFDFPIDYNNFDNVIVSSFYNPEINNPINNEFKRKYVEKYSKDPDSWAAMGYDNIKIITDAIINNNIRTSEELANYLSNSECIESIYGTINFKNDHKVSGRTIFNKKILDSKFVFVE